MCVEEALSSKVCKSCETLKMQLEVTNYEKRKLLDAVLEFNKSPEVKRADEQPANINEIKPRTIPWHVQRQMLEAEDRKKAAVMREVAERAAQNQRVADKSAPSGGQIATIEESIKELEKELNITPVEEK